MTIKEMSFQFILSNNFLEMKNKSIDYSERTFANNLDLNSIWQKFFVSFQKLFSNKINSIETK